MTRDEWQASENPQAMLDHLDHCDRLTERSLRLFAVAVCRRVQDRFHDPRIMEAVEAAERYADGLASEGELGTAYMALLHVTDLTVDIRDLDAREDWQGKIRKGVAVAARWALDVAYWRSNLPFAASSAAAIRYFEGAGDDSALAKELAAQARLVRCIFREPSSPRTELSSLPPMIASLAGAAYEERHLPSGHLDPARLAVLSDAVEEASGDRELLDHLREPGQHVRGCWAVDFALGH